MNPALTAVTALVTVAIAACGPLPSSEHRERSRSRGASAVDASDGADPASPPADSSPPAENPPPSSPSSSPAADPSSSPPADEPPSSPPSSPSSPSSPPADEPAADESPAVPTCADVAFDLCDFDETCLDEASGPVCVKTWQTVLDRELPYFDCQQRGAQHFQLILATSDALGIRDDNSDIEGSASVDANDHIVVDVPGLMSGTTANETFAYDMLLSFDVGLTSCTALAYDVADGFDAAYTFGTVLDDFEPGIYTDTFELHLNHFGQMTARRDMYFEFSGDDDFTDYSGVYFIDQGHIQAALIGSSFGFEGEIDADHNVFTFEDAMFAD